MLTQISEIYFSDFCFELDKRLFLGNLKINLLINKLEHMDKFIGLKELRENMEKYTKLIKSGESLIVLRRSVPLFRISPVEEKEEEWEEIIDFTKIKKGGIDIKDILSRI